MGKPWMTGPKELLVHGIYHTNNPTDFDIRMGMVCIDNSVELMIKTYLGLPKRVSGIEGLSRNKYNEIIQSFPKLLDALEEYCYEKLTGIDLGDIKWFHRLRNELYHNGNGITVEKTKVIIYAEGERSSPPFKRIKELYDTGKINEKTYQEFAESNKFRNELVHGHKETEKKFNNDERNIIKISGNIDSYNLGYENSSY